MNVLDMDLEMIRLTSGKKKYNLNQLKKLTSSIPSPKKVKANSKQISPEGIHTPEKFKTLSRTI